MTFWIRVRKWLQRHFGIVVFLAVYCAALFVLLPFRSLWLDEILDLIAARSPSLPSLLAAVRANEGGVPLGYILHALSMAMFGVSAFSGRLPSVIASVFGCIGVFLLAHRAGMRRPIIAVIAFAIFPLQFRYALEARGYEIALCCSIWSSVFFFRILDRPQTSRAWCLYVLSIVAGVYSQPFSMFVPVSHFIWLSVSTGRQRRLELVGVGSVILLAGLLFLPWYLYTTLAPADYPRGTLESRSILMVLRELVGAGYIGTILVLSGAVLAIRRPLKTRHDRSFWLLLIVTPIAGVVTADVAIHYFFAIRQVIFVLPPLAILLALGVESLYDRAPRVGTVLALTVLLTLIYGNVGFYRRPREDWGSATRALSEEAGKGACIYFSPPSSRSLYGFFSDELLRSECSRDFLTQARLVAIAVSPYPSKEEDYATVKIQMLTSGFREGRIVRSEATPRIVVFSKF